VAYQIGAAQALAVYSGHRITYVKPHGALTNIAEVDRDVATAIARAVRAVDESLAILAPARSELLQSAESLKLRTVAEVYADRGYAENGTLLPRGTAGALIEDSASAASRVLEMLRTDSIITASGACLPTKIGSVCVHGDSPHAVQTAKSVRSGLENAGVRISAFS